MALPVYRLRRVLAVTAVLFAALVTGMYFYARMKVRDVRKEIPHKLGIEIKQTASGFQFSKSDGKRTLFTIQASDVKELKLNGRAELHNVSIVLYGRDSSRYDQIYGDDFAYDPKTGDVTAKGVVQIDLVANPSGVATPDQSAPKEVKNPIHLKTRDLVFNRESGNAWTDAPVEFRTPQAEGTAIGVKYSGKSNVLTLSSKIHVELSGPHAAIIDAASGLVTNEPREITLERPRLERDSGSLQASHAVFHLSPDNHVERVVATGEVNTVTRLDQGKRRRRQRASTDEPPTEVRGRADDAEFLLSGDSDELRTATLRGNVQFDESGKQSMQGSAGRVVLDFAGDNELQKVQALEGAHIVQRAAAKKAGSDATPQDFDLTAPVIDFYVKGGRTLERAATSGAARITITPAETAHTTPGMAQGTVVTAGKFEATFAHDQGGNHLSAVHGAPDARIVNSTAGQPDRISTSEAIDATFLPQGGLESLTQRGKVTYIGDEGPDRRVQAWADNAHYTPADQMLVLTGNPRVANAGMATTADAIRINRTTGEALAQGDVKSTYSDLKEQPNGALLASASPIHVTARNMTVHKNPGVALYTGNVRLWQDANIIEAPSIEFDRHRRFVTAQGTSQQPVQTIIVQAEKTGAGKGLSPPGVKPDRDRSSPLAITATRLTYDDSQRKLHYEGEVMAKGADFSASAKTLDSYLVARKQVSSRASFGGPGQLDHMVAEGDIVVQEPKRRAEGQKLVYTATEDKFVLTGGPPSIFDAEQGKITGVSLTFFRRDDRVLVEGEASSPVVTTTRVAR